MKIYGPFRYVTEFYNGQTVVNFVTPEVPCFYELWKELDEREVKTTVAGFDPRGIGMWKTEDKLMGNHAPIDGGYIVVFDEVIDLERPAFEGWSGSRAFSMRSTPEIIEFVPPAPVDENAELRERLAKLEALLLSKDS